MPRFLLDFAFSLVDNLKSFIWPHEAGKRRRDSIADEEDDDIIYNVQALSKRPKWMATPYPSTNIMLDGKCTNTSRPSGRSKVIKNIPVRRENKTFHQRMSQEVKENDHDVIEVIELDSENDQNSIESRPPLSTLAVRTKPRVLYTDRGLSKTSQHSLQVPNTEEKLEINTTVPEKKQNGVHPMVCNSFASNRLRPSRPTVPKQTALNQSFKYADKWKYSKLLAEYHNFSRNPSSLKDAQEKDKTQSSLRDSSPVADSPSRLRRPEVVAVLDLTGDERKLTRLHVTPYQAHARDDNELQIIEERIIPTDNSLQRKLSQNCHVSPEWLIEIQQKYSEKEREMRRLVEEEKLKKQLYAEHNEARRLAALDERIRRHLKITDVVLDDTEQAELALPELSDEMLEKIKGALRPNPPGEGLVIGFGQTITRRDIQTLRGLNWLNDEVINFYMKMVVERGRGEKYIDVYAFDTFFYPKLVSQGYKILRRWTKKVDIFNHQLLLVPIHLGMHWCMATIDFRDKTIRYYDSMGGENNKCLNALLKYLEDESMDKKKIPYDTSNWKKVNMKDIPQQMNGSDCGMFSCMFAEYASRNAKITFSQKDMPYFRRKMVYEIITKKLLM